MRLSPTRQLHQRGNRRSGFTLMEVLVVVAILVVLASIAGFYVFRYMDDANKDKAKLDAKNLQKAAEAYMLKFSEPPTDVMQLLQPPECDPFIDSQSALIDPGKNKYQITTSATPSGSPIIEVYTIDKTGKRISSRPENTQVR